MISNNTSVDNGAGVKIEAEEYTFKSNTIVDNSCSAIQSLGGGIYCEGGTATGQNNILYNNTAASAPNHSGSVSFTYSCIEGGMFGEGNIGDDPLFESSSWTDYLLSEDSPCRDSGDPDSPLDPDGTRADMGAFCYGYTAIPTSPTDEKPEDYLMHSSYPNPFNPLTTISFSLPRSSRVSLTIYDIKGNKITKLMDCYRYAGQHQVNFDASGLGSGVYIYQLKFDGFTASGKMLFVK